MWVLVFFDLPTESRAQRTEYRRFREKLLQDGFVMLQYSVYASPCANFEDAEKHGARVERMLPPEGEVRMLTLTSQQYARMRCFFGEISRPPEQKPLQLEFF